jgi:hypothetical protein
MATTTWSFDVENVESVPEAVSRALAEAARLNKQIVDGPTIEHHETPKGERWSLSFVVQA